jgi:hypothetical protein
LRLEVCSLGHEDVGHESPRVSIAEGEPGALYRRHDSVACLGPMDLAAEVHGKVGRCVCRNRLGFANGTPALLTVTFDVEIRDPEKPFRGDIASKWLVRAERLSGLPKLAAGTWPCYRRMFAIELRALSVHDVAATAGWRSVQAVRLFYQPAKPQGVLCADQQVSRGA